jgi:sarcosine oxidase subunit alpha
LAYEIAVPSRYGDSLMRVLHDAGKEFDVVPYGLEALSVMRIEKGHAVASELTGQTTAQNLGMGRMVSKKKDCIGNTLSEREYLNRDEIWNLVGLQPVDKTQKLDAGSHFVEKGAEATMDNDLGWMTSVAYSPTLGHHIGLGFVKTGNSRKGDVIRAWDGVRQKDVEVEIVSAHFFDPEGERLRG